LLNVETIRVGKNLVYSSCVCCEMTTAKLAGKRLSPFGHALAGAGGAAIALAICYPLDMYAQAPPITVAHVRSIKTRMQVQTRDSAFSTNYASVSDAMRQIVSKEGIPGLYAGLPSGLIGVTSTNFAYFYWYAFIRKAFLQAIANQSGVGLDAVQLGTAMELALGALAGGLAQIFTIPVSVITTRQQTQVVPATPTGEPTTPSASSDALPRGWDAPKKESRRMTMHETAMLIVKEEGWTGLWKGIKPSLILTVNPAITYGFFERMKTVMLTTKRQSDPAAELKSLDVFYLGLLSKTIATVVTYPYIMAKVRLQWKPADYAVNEKVRYKSAAEVLRRVLAAEGIQGWYKVSSSLSSLQELTHQGMSAQIVKAVLTQALLFVIKDKLTLYTYLVFVAIKTAAGGQARRR
jgi:hypothetical protein